MGGKAQDARRAVAHLPRDGVIALRRERHNPTLLVERLMNVNDADPLSIREFVVGAYPPTPCRTLACLYLFGLNRFDYSEVQGMGFAIPLNTRSEVNRSGEALLRDALNPEPISTDQEFDDFLHAYIVLNNWRASHAYPINTFQALLRKKLKDIDRNALVAQRLKRYPSIVAKLERYPEMKLARMQDIGGLRAVVSSMPRVRRLEAAYRDSRFKHKLVSFKDYIASPKPDGYRSIHLIYKYDNPRAPEYKGLLLELQLRTKLQHAWATAVETMGTFLGQALKSGKGEPEWRKYFSIASAAIAVVERTAAVPGFEKMEPMNVFKLLQKEERRLKVLPKLRSFAIAADKIKKERGQGPYHLVILDSRARSVSIHPYQLANLDQANADYAAIEKRAAEGEPVEAVLVSVGSVQALKKAYPNFFLDTQAFVLEIERIFQILKLGE